MFNKQENNEEQNFWVSYADLMAGLLFVFILVLGVILIKYMTIENKLSGKNNLVSSLRVELLKNKNALSIEEELNKELIQKNQNITLELEDKNIIIQDTSNSLELSKNEAFKLKNIILNYELSEENNLKTISNLKEEITNKNNTISLNAKELSKLASIILLQKRTHKSLVDEFSLAKSKIKTLTGIRVKVIKKLKQKLGKSINIDNKSGAIRFYSNILFDQNKFKLKEKSKKVLSKTLKKYIKTILYNKKIRKHIDKIIIEGHTNTDGTYLHNLELSQKRALEVMKFLYSIETKNKKLLAEYVSASGRSYSDVIRYKNKKENKNASRRIEIKFQLKNEQYIKQLSKYFDKKK
jgi:chemotaxis protein MotB